MTETALPDDRTQLYERILASTRDHLSLVDRSYVYRLVNDAYLAAHARVRDDIEGQHVASLLGRDTFEGVVRPRLDRALAGEVVEYEDWFEFQGIGRRRMSVAYFPYLLPDDSEPWGVLVRATDVTRERAMQADLRDRDERLELFFEAAQLGTWEWLIDQDELLWSDRALELFGTRRADFGHTFEAFLEFVHEEDRPELNRAVQRAIMDPTFGDGWEVEYRIVRGDAEVRWQHARGAILRDEAGRTQRMLGIVSDVTERKSLEVQLSHSQKLDAIGRLAGGMAHDFNNLLTAIVSSAEIGARARDEAQVQDAFTLVTTAAERAATLIKKLLTFAHLGTYDPSFVEINAALRSLRGMLERLLPETIEVRFSPSAEPLYAYIDPSQLEQVVVNLSVNARDAMPDGGNLSITTSREEIPDPPSSRSWVRIDVRDEGCGIPRTLHDRVLEPFFTTKAAGVGSGLGLATCHGVVQRAGGSIELDSAVGAGTTVIVRLPEVHPPEGADVAERAEPPPRRGVGERIALVEDDALVRETTRVVLEGAGYEVLAFGSGREALEALAGPEPEIALLLTDVVMPDVTGPALARGLRAHRPDLEVLLMSGYAREARESVEGFRLLEKPFSSRELMTALTEALGDG